MMRLFHSLCFLLVLGSLTFAQDEPKRGPSTPEERKRLISIVQKMEKSPLDKNLDKDIKWALDWVRDVPDVTVNLCWAPLDPAIHSEYRYRAKLPGRFALASAAFIVEHPDKAHNEMQQYIAGVEGVVKTYKAILKAHPDPKPAKMHYLF